MPTRGLAFLTPTRRITRMKITLFLCLFTVSLFARPLDEIIVVALGGYTSCGSGGPTSMGMYTPVKKLIDDLKVVRAERRVHYVIGCLDSAAPPKGKGQFISSRLRGKAYSGDTSDIQREIETISKSSPNAPIFLAGHSYGGWQAMYLSTRLPAAITISGLYTIDPISNKCGASEVIFGSQECRRAPREFDNLAIQKRVGDWRNLYQDQDSWIHSSEISEAKNHHIVYRGPHTEIDADERTWDLIKSSVYSEVN